MLRTAPPSETPRASSRPICAHSAAALANGLAVILTAFAQFVFGRFHVIGEPTGIALHHRITRACRRLQHLLALAAQGREPRQYTPRSTRAHASPRPSSALPRHRGWGGDLLGHHGNAYGGQLHHLLTQPDTIALLRAAPARTRLAAARAVRPILHMFAWDLPDVLQQAGPPRPRRKRPPAPSRPGWPAGQRRPANHPFPMRPEDKPLRPWVARTARAWKKTGG